MKPYFAGLLLLLTFAACPDAGGGATDSGTSTSGATDSETSTSGVGDLPPVEEVCPAACEKFRSCADDPAMFDVDECVTSCAAGVEFLGANNPGTECAQYELGRQDCLSRATCEQIDVYVAGPGAGRPCMEWDDRLADCAIE